MTTIKSTEQIRDEQARPRQVGDMKHGLGGARPQMSILPRIGMIYGGRAIEYGADKYARGNYHGPPPAKLGDNAEAKRLLGYVDAAMRHLSHVSDAINRALGTGGDVAAACAVVDDEASGNFPPSMLPHLSHALASLLIGVSCAADGKLVPVDPGQPWKALLASAEPGLPQKDDPALERERVAVLALRAELRGSELNVYEEALNVLATLHKHVTVTNVTQAMGHVRDAMDRATNPDRRRAMPVPVVESITVSELDDEIEAGFAGRTP